jgi:hypothetical protein
MRGVGGRGLSLDDRRGRSDRQNPERRLPGVRIDTVSIASLSRDVQAAFFKTLARRASLKGGALATRTVGIDALAHFKVTATEFSRLERIVLTFVILGSNLCAPGGRQGVGGESPLR